MRQLATPDALRLPFARRRTWRQRIGGKRAKALLALVAAITVPAMAAPSEWRAFDLGPEQPRAQTNPMPFEQPGASFPGSAFFYVDADAGPVGSFHDNNAGTSRGGRFFDPLTVLSGNPAQAVETRSAGPAARAFRSAGSGLDMARALHCLASAVYYEAASESLGGQKAVAQVVLNRVAHPAYPNSVCGVVYQGSERQTGCQFSFTCDGSLRRKASGGGWSRALRVAREALAGEVYRPVGLATHYHTIWINPYWAPSLDFVGVIGAHRFYRWRGDAGRPQAFRAVYSGGERWPGPGPAASSENTPNRIEPEALTRATAMPEGSGYSGTPRSAGPAPAGFESQPGSALDRREASLSQEPLPLAGRVREEYANAGRWKPQP